MVSARSSLPPDIARARLFPPLGLLLREIRCDETVIDLLTRVPVTFQQADNRHTIILVQTTSNKKSRTFMDFEKVSMAMNGALLTPPPRIELIGHPENRSS